MEVQICRLLLILGCLWFSGTCGKSCTVQQINTCLEPLEGYEYELTNAIVPTMDEQSLRDHCRRYDLFEDCMADVKPQCSTVDRKIFEGIEDSYQFLCYDGFDDYKQHRDCFLNTDLHREGDSCNQTFHDRLQNIGSSYSLSYRQDRICQYVKQYLDCVENVVESFCGSEAAKWQRTLDVYSLQPLLEQIGCSLVSYAEQHWLAITLGIVITLSIIIIIFSLALICKKRYKRRQASPTSVENPVVGAPPPYGTPAMVYNPGPQTVTNHHAQAGPVPQKADFVDPPPYQPTEDPASAPAYERLSPPAGSGDGAVAAGYFGVNPAVGQSHSTTPVIDEKLGPVP